MVRFAMAISSPERADTDPQTPRFVGEILRQPAGARKDGNAVAWPEARRLVQRCFANGHHRTEIMEGNVVHEIYDELRRWRCRWRASGLTALHREGRDFLRLPFIRDLKTFLRQVRYRSSLTVSYDDWNQHHPRAHSERGRCSVRRLLGHRRIESRSER